MHTGVLTFQVNALLTISLWSLCLHTIEKCDIHNEHYIQEPYPLSLSLSLSLILMTKTDLNSANFDFYRIKLSLLKQHYTYSNPIYEMHSFMHRRCIWQAQTNILPPKKKNQKKKPKQTSEQTKWKVWQNECIQEQHVDTITHRLTTHIITNESLLSFHTNMKRITKWMYKRTTCGYNNTSF